MYTKKRHDPLDSCLACQNDNVFCLVRFVVPPREDGGSNKFSSTTKYIMIKNHNDLASAKGIILTTHLHSVPMFVPSSQILTSLWSMNSVLLTSSIL